MAKPVGAIGEFIDQMAVEGYRGPTTVGYRFLERFDPPSAARSPVDPESFRPHTGLERQATEEALAGLGTASTASAAAGR